MSELQKDTSGAGRAGTRRLFYFLNLIRYAFRSYPIYYFCVILLVVSIALELLALMTLIPLGRLANDSQTSAAGGIIANFIDQIGLTSDLKTLTIAFLALIAGRVVTYCLYIALVFELGKRVQGHLAVGALYSIISKMSVGQIESRGPGHFMSLIGDETCRAATIVTNSFSTLSYFILCVLYFGAMAKFSIPVATGILIFMFVNSFLMFGIFRRLNNLSGRMVEESRAQGAVFIDALTNLRSVKSFAAEDFVTEKFRDKIFKCVKTIAKVETLPILAKGGPIILLSLVALVLAAKAGPTFWNRFDAPFVMTILACVMRFFPTVGGLLNSLMKLVSDLKVGENVLELVGLARGHEKAVKKVSGPIRSIELKDIRFSYDSSAKLFDSLSLKFEAGKSYAIVGPSGVGKSTLVDLLFCFRAAQAGSILVNSESIIQPDPSILSERLILISQTTSIFNDSILNNIRLGKNLSMAQIHKAVEWACLDEFVASLDRGMDTYIDYQGSNLSGGQRQRLALARALSRDFDVLVLDEAINALDSETRDRVFDQVIKLCADRIVIFITHDESVMSRVDVVIDVGAKGVKVA